ncbi:pyridoxal 5'-phosphate synthase glutaminase subunit PdxT [bacterium]|nr:pyridoxal 5'-phosphate synthase glutaminase subunit PdxT [bacterium]
MLVGILALQGAVEPHAAKLSKLGIESRLVKQSKDLIGLKGIILPGGESSTMLHLLKLRGLCDDLKTFVHEKPCWGLCAGAILMAKEVKSPTQDSLKCLDIGIIRNAYGRQNESFVSNLKPSLDWIDQEPLEGVFIRAPKISWTTSPVKTLFSFEDEPVMVQEGNKLASTFHPELSESNKLHQYFVKLCQETA